MADVFAPQKRSEVMSRIRSRGNRATELRMIALFREGGITGWRRNWPLHGRPDFVFPQLRLAIFVDGCFWHGCPAHYNAPVNNAEFWLRKIEANRRRDRKVTRTLRSSGWHVARIWEHALERNEQGVMTRLRQMMNRIDALSKHSP